jgi:hypothetical protein
MLQPHDLGTRSGRRRRHRHRVRKRAGWLVLILLATISATALGVVGYQFVAEATRARPVKEPPKEPATTPWWVTPPRGRPAAP